MSIQYAGGTNVNATYTGGVKADHLTNILSNLLTAGWSKISGITPSTVTFTTGTPGVVNLSAHGLADGTCVVFTSTGTLPTGITGNTTVYYVKSPLTNSFNLATTNGGAAIALSGTPTGTATMNCELLMQTATTPQGYALRSRLRDNGGTCIQISIESTDGTKVGTNDTSHGASLLPTAAKTFRIIANQYQFCVFSPGDFNVAREWALVCCPYVFSFFPTLANIGFLVSNCWSDGDTSTRIFGNWRYYINAWSPSISNMQMLYDTNFWETSGVNVGNPCGPVQFYLPAVISFGFYGSGQLVGQNVAESGPSLAANPYLYGNGDSMSSDPIVAWGLTGYADYPQVRGQLWDALIIQDQFTGDTTTSFDTHNWYCVTATATSATYQTLFMVVP